MIQQQHGFRAPLPRRKLEQVYVAGDVLEGRLPWLAKKVTGKRQGCWQVTVVFKRTSVLERKGRGKEEEKEQGTAMKRHERK